MFLYLCQQVVQAVGVGFSAQDGGFVEGLETLFNVVAAVNEVEHKGIFLLRTCAVKSRKGLNGLQSMQRLVYIHAVQQWFVVARLKLVGHDKEAIFACAERLFYLRRGKSVKAGLVNGLSVVLKIAAKSHDGFVLRTALFQ